MNWDLIASARAVFERVLDASPEERLELLEGCGPPDSPLRREVESLLARLDSKDSTLEKSLPELLASLSTPVIQRLRDYEIIRPLGHGGMGRVYLARKADRLQQREVAIKVINRAFVSSEIDSRFRREVSALSKLSHPNIVQLLDGGITEDGLLYMVMEYVAGKPIDLHCRERGLSVEETLAVFLQLCGAVSYAHRNLVIHRDLKPSNVLVTDDGTVKLLDFGVAKLLDEESPEHFTTAGLNRVTVEYSSPEQLSTKHPVSTTSDVYSLGVMLYEILSGRLPYNMRGSLAHEIVATVIEDEPVRPNLSPELISILFMALRKEPERRYASVDYLKDDIDRYLRKLPVAAFRDSAWYRVGKFLRRRGKIAAAAGIAIVSVLAAVASALYQAEQAKRRFEQVRHLADQVFLEIDGRLLGVRGALEAQLYIREMGARFLGQLVEDSPEDEKLAQRFIYALLFQATRLSDLEGSHVGKTAEARKVMNRAVAAAEKYVKIHPKDDQNVGLLSISKFYLAKNMIEEGDSKSALALLERTLAFQEKFCESTSDTEPHEIRAMLLSWTGYQLALSGERSRSMDYHRRALELRRRFLAEAKEDWLILKQKRHVSEALYVGARAQRALGLTPEALNSATEVVAIERELLTVNNQNLVTRVLLGQRLFLRAGLLHDVGNVKEASRDAEESVAILRRIVEDEKGDWGYKRDLGRSLGVLAAIRVDEGRRPEAVLLLKEQLGITAAAAESDPASAVAKKEWLSCKAKLSALTGEPQ